MVDWHNQENKSVNGVVFDIKRYALHDGPGIRTTVFLKGCPLSCPWCHNPEGIEERPQLLYYPDRCIECGACRPVCPTCDADAYSVDCIECFACVLACPSEARMISGKVMTAEEVMGVVDRDRVFYDKSGGGVTFSGGEPLHQFEFLLTLCQLANQREYHVALDTTGYVQRDQLDMLVPHVDLFLYDLKCIDDDCHRELTGVSNQRVLRNLSFLSSLGQRIILRIPLLSGLNDDLQSVQALGKLAQDLVLSRLDLLPYHRLGEDKWTRLNRVSAPNSFTPPSASHIRSIQEVLEDFGLDVRISG